MKTSVSWSMVAMVAFLAAGCNTSGPFSEGSNLYPLGGKPLAPRAPTTAGVPCQTGGPAKTCTIAVSVTNPADPKCPSDSILLDDYVVLPPIDSKDKIVWQLSAGYVFCARAGDGVFLKDPNVSDLLFDPTHNPKCSDTYEWKRKMADGQTNVEYLLRFRSAVKSSCVKDPWMRN